MTHEAPVQALVKKIQAVRNDPAKLAHVVQAALAQARREVWEEVAKHLETYPNRVLYGGETIAVLDERAAYFHAQASQEEGKP